MDYLWSPWRFRYVSQGAKGATCVFCEKISRDSREDREQLVLYRGKHNLLLLNLFPYTTGHTMVIPYQHVADLVHLDEAALHEMMSLARDLQSALESTYKPEGYNLGINLGKCAGAGVADHVHMHVLPRWSGDSNFMTVIAETRVQPEDLLTTYDKLVGHFARQAAS